MPQKIHLPNPAYPFRLTELESSVHRDYRIERVYEQLTPAQREAIVDLWVSNRVLSREAAIQRSAQVCYLVTQVDNGEVVGVSTLYPDRVGEPPRSALMMRMFITPNHRRSWLAKPLWTKTLVFAKTNLAERGYVGVVNVNENRKLARSNMRKRFESVGYQLLGQWHGQDVWLYEFTEIEFADSGAAE